MVVGLVTSGVNALLRFMGLKLPVTMECAKQSGNSFM